MVENISSYLILVPGYLKPQNTGTGTGIHIKAL